MKTEPDMDLLFLEGAPRERGRSHGEALRPKIQELIGAWKEGLGQDLGSPAEPYLAQFLQDTAFLPAIQKWTPDLLQEVHGIAEGAGVDWDIILAFQLPDEEWWYRRERKQHPAGQSGQHCSGLGAFAQDNGPTLMAQNMDVPAYYDGYQTLLRIRRPASDLETLVFTAAGLIALNGINNRGIGVCVNTLMQLNHASDGLPVAFVIRGLLERTSHEQALAFLQGVRHASGQNFIVGGPDQVWDLECSASQVARFIPQPGLDRVYHTNHPLVNTDQSMHHEMVSRLSPEQRERIARGRSDTSARFDYLASQLSDASQTITVERVRAILSSHQAPVCVDRGGSGLTLGCTIMELSPVAVLHIAPGPPCSTAFQTFTLT
ncbi:MAG: C45 family autoproteolytic acyltransferase/hydrolase [Chloroflexota bacterium]